MLYKDANFNEQYTRADPITINYQLYFGMDENADNNLLYVLQPIELQAHFVHYQLAGKLRNILQ